MNHTAQLEGLFPQLQSSNPARANQQDAELQRAPAGPSQPFGTCSVPSCHTGARVLDADSQGNRVLCVRCGRAEPVLRHALRVAMASGLLGFAAAGAGIALLALIAWLARGMAGPAWLFAIVGLTLALGAAGGWAARLILTAAKLRDRLRWASAWEVDITTLPGWGQRQAALLGLLRDLRIGNTRSLEEVVWKAQRDAEDAVRKAWIAPHDPQSAQHLTRVRAFGPYMDQTVRSFIARLPRNQSVETEVHALVEALREAMDA